MISAKTGDSEIKYFFLKSIFCPSDMIKEVQSDEQHIIQTNELQAITLDSKILISEENLLCYLNLQKEALKDSQDSRKIVETKAQSMIGYITFSVSLVTLFIGNANSLLDHGVGGIFLKIGLVIFLVLPIVMMILSGLFAKNVVITDFYYRSPTYNAVEIKKKHKISFYQQQIKDLSISIRSHNIFNNFKVTSLKYSHLCFQLALYSFFVFFMMTIIVFIIGGTPKSKEKIELFDLRKDIIEVKKHLHSIEIKNNAEKIELLNKIDALQNKSKQIKK